MIKRYSTYTYRIPIKLFKRKDVVLSNSPDYIFNKNEFHE